MAFLIIFLNLEDFGPSTVYAFEGVSNGDLIVIVGGNTQDGYSNLHPTDLVGCKEIGFSDYGSGWTRCFCILEVTNSTFSFKTSSRMNCYNCYAVLKRRV